MVNSVTGKVAIVTGGGSGIGESLCRELARRGARVVVADIDGENAGRVAAAIAGDGGHAEARSVDVAREEDVRRLVEERAAVYGHLDFMFNNAGIAIGGEARDLTLDHWQRVLDVDLYGVLHGIRAAYPIMVRQGFGHIVNTSSAAAFFAYPGNAPYCTAKHAVLGLSLSLRLEAAGLGVKVSCACPGFVRTNIYQSAQLAGVTLPAGADREQLAGALTPMMTSSRAARMILDGVARDKALIVFPASMRWARRVNEFFPGLVDWIMVRQLRQFRKYRTAAPVGP
jgi:NAD(P)-dependent dehydrogenase (short-subunit alcohol dehydrogenase family)